MRVVAACSDHRCALRGSHTPMQQRGDTTLRDWWCAPARPQTRGASEQSCGRALGGGCYVGNARSETRPVFVFNQLKL